MAGSKANHATRAARILIVDDHPAVREGLAMRINGHRDLEVCGEAPDVAEAMQLVATTNPDAAIVDIALKTGNGIDLIKRFKARYPSVRILVWSMYSESLYAERALRAGASGYINKEHATDQIITAIRTVLDGKLYLTESMSTQLIGRMMHGNLKEAKEPIATLSDRELEVFRLIGEGFDTHQVAEKMSVSPKTVETYRGRIKEKLELTSSAALLRQAMRWVLEREGK